MQVFKTFFKISKKYVRFTIMYMVIFIGIMFGLSASGGDNTVESFKSTSLDVAIFDHDGSELSKGIYEYMASLHNIVDIDEDIDIFRDEMYNQSVDYILIIPKGFSDSIANGTLNENNLKNELSLSNYKIHGSVTGQFVDLQINQFILAFKTYKSAGFSYDEAYENTLETMETTTNVTLKNSSSSDTPLSSSYYRYIPYILTCIVILGISPILIAFNKPEIRKRNMVSSVSTAKNSISIGLASLVYGLIIFAVIVDVSLITKGSEMMTATGLMYIVNTFAHLLVCLGLAFLLAQITRNANVLNMYSNVIGLGSSFLCGIFVPREFLPQIVENIGRFFPAYWYINVHTEVLNMSTASMSVIFTGLGVQMLYAVVLFSVGICVAKNK